MKLPLFRRHRTARYPNRGPDPTVQVVHDALAFATAAIEADTDQVRAIANDALATDATGFLDALATTVSVIAEEADEHGADIRTALREIAVGVHIAAMAEARAGDGGPDETEHDHQHDHQHDHDDLEG